MMGFKSDGGKIMGITPNLLVVPPSLEGAARDLVKAPTAISGSSSTWYQSAEVIVSPYLA